MKGFDLKTFLEQKLIPRAKSVVQPERIPPWLRRTLDFRISEASGPKRIGHSVGFVVFGVIGIWMLVVSARFFLLFFKAAQSSGGSLLLVVVQLVVACVLFALGGYLAFVGYRHWRTLRMLKRNRAPR